MEKIFCERAPKKNRTFITRLKAADSTIELLEQIVIDARN